MAKKRNPSFEILRVLAMFLIVVWHFMIHGVGLKQVGVTDTPAGLFNFCAMEYIGCLAKVSTNCYILITGYFMINSVHRWRKLAKVWLPVFFYSFFICLILLLCGKITGWDKLWHSALPLWFDRYWFATKYVALFALAPFLSIVAKGVDRSRYLYLLGILLVINLDFLLGKSFSSNNSLLWFIFLFFMGGYIRLHGNFSGRNHYGKLYFATAAVIAVTTLATTFAHYSVWFAPISVHYHNNNGVAFLSALFLFLWTAKLKVGDNAFSRFMMRIAPLTFGVYLIHDNEFVRRIVWNEMFDAKAHVTGWEFVPYMLGVVLAIYAVCTLIDYGRERLFALLRVNDRVDRLADKVNTFDFRHIIKK
ncbi:MAG: acyltransferase [Bacteroidales bacterium]|nr:acyltransferase [Bacteroidales bacterium]